MGVKGHINGTGEKPISFTDETTSVQIKVWTERLSVEVNRESISFTFLEEKKPLPPCVTLKIPETGESHRRLPPLPNNPW